MKTDEQYLMWLLSIDGISNRRANMLIDLFEGLENIWYAKKDDFKNISGLSTKIIDDITSSKKESRLEGLIESIEKHEISFVPIFNKKYPKALKNIPDAPLGLYIKGEIPGDNFINISVIGSRVCSEYGLTSAYKLSKELAQNSVTIVSGMARGIDGMAHKGALEAKGKTIAVLGNGLDICYPPENYGLMNEIIENGCVISEYPPGTKPFRANFPARNRIISGLSRGLLVVEAGEKSGTSITVEQALEQGREIFAVPGNIFSKTSRGTNKLIKDGACLVMGCEDIFNCLGIDTFNIMKDNKEKQLVDDKILSMMTNDEKNVYDCIGIEPISVDDICIKTDMNIQMIQFCLTTLELNGCIKRLPGQRYIRF